MIVLHLARCCPWHLTHVSYGETYPSDEIWCAFQNASKIFKGCTANQMWSSHRFVRETQMNTSRELLWRFTWAWDEIHEFLPLPLLIDVLRLSQTCQTECFFVLLSKWQITLNKCLLLANEINEVHIIFIIHIYFIIFLDYSMFCPTKISKAEWGSQQNYQRLLRILHA